MDAHQVAEFRGYMDVAAVLAKASLPEDDFGAKHGAATTLPPAPWHTDLFAQVSARVLLDWLVTLADLQMECCN